MPTSSSAAGLPSRAATAARLGGLVVLFLSTGTPAASAHENHVIPSTPGSTVVVRWLVLWIAALVVAVALRKGSGRRRVGVAVLAALANGVAATASTTWAFAVVTIAHRTGAALWLGALLALISSRGRLWRSLSRVAVPAAAVVAASGVVLARLDRAGLDGFTFDRLVLLKVLLFTAACAAAALGWRTRQRRWQLVDALALTAASVLGSLLVLVPAPPPAGVPLLTAAGSVPVTVVPQRPGLNLVHVDSDTPVLVAGYRTTTYPGASGQWALVPLPPGRSVLHVGTDSILLDTGHLPSRLSVAGPDGPECASALLGAELAHRALKACPASSLREADRRALVALVAWLNGRHVRDIAIASDATARSHQAAQALRVALRSHHMRESAGGALIVTGGWSSTDQVLKALDEQAGPTAGTYLAPWDLTGPLLTSDSAAAPLLALPFDPNGQQAVRYLQALPPGETATASGLAAFDAPPSAISVWATTPASIFPRDLGHDHTSTRGWFPGGALVPIT